MKLSELRKQLGENLKVLYIEILGKYQNKANFEFFTIKNCIKLNDGNLGLLAMEDNPSAACQIIGLRDAVNSFSEEDNEIYIAIYTPPNEEEFISGELVLYAVEKVQILAGGTLLMFIMGDFVKTE